MLMGKASFSIGTVRSGDINRFSLEAAPRVRVSHGFVSRADRTVAAVELACGENASMTARCSASISPSGTGSPAHTTDLACMCADAGAANAVGYCRRAVRGTFGGDRTNGCGWVPNLV
jgi:hypothetical protein